MAAATFKRKRPSRSESEGPFEKATKGRFFLTRPSRKKKGLTSEPAKAASVDKSGVQWKSHTEQAEWLNSTFHAVFGSQLSPLELDPIPEDRLVQLAEERDHSVESLGAHVKTVIGPTWKDILCGEDKAGVASEAGSPVVLVLSSSAIRCVELLRGLKVFTGKCKPVKLFAKHIKVEEQVTALEERVNIAAGTPNRVRKLMDIGALGLGRLRLVLLDLQCDAKGLTLLSVPQVMSEFWDLYRAHLHERVGAKQVQLCLY